MLSAAMRSVSETSPASVWRYLPGFDSGEGFVVEENRRRGREALAPDCGAPTILHPGRIIQQDVNDA